MNPTPEMFALLRSRAQSFSRKVAPIYHLLGWKWALDRARGRQVPSERDVMAAAIKLIDELEDLADTDVSEVTSGGIRVAADENGVHLIFELSTSVLYGDV
jgi:hypothetical protein